MGAVPVPVLRGLAFDEGLRGDAAPGEIRMSGIEAGVSRLKNAGVIASSPETFVRPGELDHRALLMLLGLAVTVLMLKMKS